MIPELTYSTISPSESGFSESGIASPAESDAIRTPSFSEHHHPLLAFTVQSPEASVSERVHAHSHDIHPTKTACEFGPTKGYGLLPSLYLDSSRVDETSLDSDGSFECEYSSPISNDAFSSPILPKTPSPPRKTHHTFPPYNNTPRTPVSEYIVDSSVISRHFPPGHRLNPHFLRIYQLGDELGSGGYGFVVTAKHRIEGHEVAVKFIIKDKVPDYAWIDDERYGRLPTEVLLLSNIDHENIVRCLDVFEDAKYYYLVQELHGTPWHNPRQEDGQNEVNEVPALSPSASVDSISSLCPLTPSHIPRTLPSHSTSPFKLEVPLPPKFSRRPSHDLFECIEQSENKCLSEDQARYVFAQIVDAVDYLDSLGIAHRDIKDENIVIDENLQAKLIDFGSATFSNPSEPRPYYNLFYGTTAYAASEILQKKVYQAAPAEMWTLGVLLSYLLTGTSPFPTVKEAVEGRIVFSDYVRLSPQALNLMHACLDPDPRTRMTIQEVKNHPWLNPICL
ncbi:kinase-like domain-containing protein [Rhodocollybia butyracea]|uniref:Kinase-like domain-containing protein n=1 Tax=Rhodocollybia butyracea TaxID=206335 RepID=A0A9P5PSW6_9AGAR|nr:kinase-like domain-containing protein [Rhodocollybia butyracea]